MRRIVLWVMSTLTVLVLLFGYRTSTSSTGVTGSRGVAAAPITGGTDGGSSGGGTSGGTGGGATTAPAAPRTGSGTAQSGTVTGDSVDTRWGPVQVRLTIAAGKITKVSVPVYPDNNGRDQEINSQALPMLVQETIEAQSANIDMISGATVTSRGYIGSLQSALDKAGI